MLVSGLFVAGTYVAFVSSGLLSGLACCALVSVIWLNCGADFSLWVVVPWICAGSLFC
jgi:hypothetical protein